MAAVILFGGHGKVALATTALLSARGDEVTAVIRNPDHAGDVRAHGGTPVVGDVEGLDLDGFTALVQGHDAVVWSAGAGGGSPARTYAVDRDAAIVSMQAALAAGVGRYVMVSWSGSRLAHGVAPDAGFYPYAQAKIVADAVLRDSGLDWTVVAPTTLTDEDSTGLVGPADAPDAPGSVPRADVAAVVAAVLADPASVGRTLRFASGRASVAEFVAG